MNKILITFLLYLPFSASSKNFLDSLTFIFHTTSILERDSLIDNWNEYYKNASNETSLLYFKTMYEVAREHNEVTQEFNAIRCISDFYMKKEILDSSLFFAQKFRQRSIEEQNSEFLIHSYNQIGRVHHHFQDYKNAQDNYLKGIEIYHKDSVGKIAGYIYSNLSILSIDKGDLDSALYWGLKSLELGEQIGDSDIQSNAISTIGNIYLNLENYERAEEYQLKALSDSTSFTSEIDRFSIYRNLGLIYSRWGKYEKARLYYFPALSYFKATDDIRYTCDMLTNIATMYYREEVFDSALVYQLESLEYGKKMNSIYAISVISMNLAGIYIKLGRFKQAENHLINLNNEFDMMTEYPSMRREIKSELYNSLHDVYREKGDYKKALENYKLYKFLSDSILIEQRDSKILEVETKYHNEEKDRINSELQLKIEREEAENLKSQHHITVIILIVCILFVCSAFLSYLLIKNIKLIRNEQKKYKKELDTLNTELDKSKQALKEDYQTREIKFHDELQHYYQLKDIYFEVWILQIQGYRESELVDRLHLTKNGLKKRRSALSTQIKLIEKIDDAQQVTSSDLVKLYRKKHKEFFI